MPYIIIGLVCLFLVALTYYFFGTVVAAPIIEYPLIFLQVIVVFFTAYFFALAVFGFRKRKKEELKDPEKKFAVLVAAHNEEAVIGNIVKNLNELDYPKDLYDVYVICDNCSDNTAKIVREIGGKAIAMERFDETKKGKGYGLEWMFQHLWDMEKEGKVYDAVVMFDADNLVKKDFLKIMNTKLLNGDEVIQGYLDSKNPNDTWITKSYAYAYWVTNRIFQLARENIGLSAQLGGTGVVVTTKVLKEIGWGATSLTEDLEFTQRYILKTGKRIAWAHEAKVYDEKPLGFVASWRQRIRWMQGHSYCMMHYSWPLFKKFLKTRRLIYFDTLIYLLQPSKILMGLTIGFLGILSVFYEFFNHLFTTDNVLVTTFFESLFDWKIFLSLIIVLYAIPTWGLIVEKRYKQIFWLPFVYVYALTWLPITLIGFIKRNQKTWVHTQHNRNVEVDEIELG